MLIEQIIGFELREPRPPGRMCICTYTTSYFHGMTKQKSLRNIVEWIILFTVKILQDAMYLTLPTWAKSRTKFNPI